MVAKKMFLKISKRLYIRLLVVLIVSSVLGGICWSFYKQKPYYTELPLKFLVSNSPYIDVTIEGADYPLKISLGSRLEVEIHSDVLKQFNKYPSGVEKWKNIRGKEFEQQTYTLPEIRVGSIVFRNPTVVDYPPELGKESNIRSASEEVKSTAETVGCLGRGLLKQVNMLLDVGRAKVIFTNSFKKLKDGKYDLTTFEKSSFKLDPKGIIIEVDTDLGKMKLLLNTGFTVTMLHEFLYPQKGEKIVDSSGFAFLTSSKFVINNHDFGSKGLYFLNMTEELNVIDGALGMDFISKHVMYIDFSKKVLYIQK